jgi:hypothetical protein
VNFLPQVWDTVVDADDFVALLWRKADLHPAEWPDGLRIATYAVDEIEAAGPRFLQAVSRVG